MKLLKQWVGAALFVILTLAAVPIQAAETEIYTVRDSGFVRHNLLDFLVPAQDVYIGFVNGGAGGQYRGYLDFLCDPPFFTAHPGANILSVTLKLNVKVPNVNIASAQYKAVNLESLLNPAAPDSVVGIGTNNTAAEIFNAMGSGSTLATFANFTQTPVGVEVSIPLNKDLIDLSAKTKNYYIGLREEGDNNGLVVFNGINDTPLAQLVITYDYSTPASSFSWATYLPAILGGGECSTTNLNACRTEADCHDASGSWDGSRCMICPFTGSYAGTWSEISCDLLAYKGDWNGTIDNRCYFRGYDDDDFLKGYINPATGQSTSLTGGELDCGPVTGTATFTDSGVTGTYTGSGVNGTFTGTKP